MITKFNEEDLVWWAGEVFFIYSLNNDGIALLKHIKNKHESFLKISTERLTKANEVQTVNDWRLMIARSKLQMLMDS